MSANRLRRLEDLYHAALARPANEREAYLRDACGGDAALQDEVRSLVAHAASADGFLEQSPIVSRLALEPGRVLGPYVVGKRMGAGGMGEVYRAHDTRLGRSVAIGDLPPEVAADPERRERFEREAKVIAALNHPSIVTIHSVEQSDDLRFLTMELVEGKTLRDLVRAADCRSVGCSISRCRSPKPWRRTRTRHRPSGSQACQRDGDARGPGQGARFRSRETL